MVKHGYSNFHGLNSIRQTYALVRYKLANKVRFADIKYRAYLHIRERLMAILQEPLEEKRLLEIGCGQWLSNVKLFAAAGSTVVGIDPEAPPSSLYEYVRLIKDCGLQRALKTAVNTAFFARQFDARLEQLSDLKLGTGYYTVERVGGENLPLDDNTIDAVFSDNVFEHLPNVDPVAKEMARVLRPGGVALIIIHPFACYSGGHHPATFNHAGEARSTSAIPPWDHLRGMKYSSGVYCNGLRAAEYKSVFSQYLNEVYWTEIGPEREDLLTADILRELPEYDREELLTGKLIYAGRKV